MKFPKNLAAVGLRLFTTQQGIRDVLSALIGKATPLSNRWVAKNATQLYFLINIFSNLFFLIQNYVKLMAVNLPRAAHVEDKILSLLKNQGYKIDLIAVYQAAF